MESDEYVEHQIEIDGEMFDSIMLHIATNFPQKTLADVSVNLSTYGRVIAEQIGLETVVSETVGEQ